ncbi:MAG: HU family DNA-binding protein [Bacteroidales bacterium]|nr:HU family DNA-binding protein [Bacteroidales bacterium]
MIRYVRVFKKVNVGAAPGMKYLARLFRGNDVTIDQLCQEITESTTLSYPDVLACLKAFEINIAKHVQNGSAVKFNILGSFIPKIKATAKETLEEVDASTIKNFSCRFYPSVDFKRNLAKANFVEADLNIKGIQFKDEEEVVNP